MKKLRHCHPTYNGMDRWNSLEWKSEGVIDGESDDNDDDDDDDKLTRAKWAECEWDWLGRTKPTINGTSLLHAAAAVAHCL